MIGTIKIRKERKMANDNISIETYALIAKAGVLMGQLNPKKDPDKLVKAMINMQCEAYMNLGENKE